MTAPMLTTEDFMFDLDLRVVPVEEKQDLTGSPHASGNGCVQIPEYTWTGCGRTYTCTCNTCRRACMTV